MTEIVTQGIDTRVSLRQPPGQQVDGQWKSIHLHEERDDEGREGPKRPPITRRLRLEEAEREDDEDERIDHD